MHLHHLFDANLIGRREQPAIDVVGGSGDRSFTFGELDARAGRMAAVLLGEGLRRGDRLGIYLSNGLEYIDLFLACMRLGIIFVPINRLYRDREVGHIVRDAEPVAVVTDEDEPTANHGAQRWHIPWLSARASDQDPMDARTPLDGDTPAVLVYTSGTTGRSKGAVLTHNNLMANTANLLAAWRITSDDRYLATLPLFHVHGLANGLVSWLVSGCHLILPPRFESAQIARWFTDCTPTVFFGVPTMYHRLLQLPADVARAIGKSMRLFVCGSAPLPAQVHDAFRAHFGHVILERYGMSETLMNIGNPYAGERRPGSVGVPFPGVSIRIVGPDGSDVPDDTVGELWVRGPNVCAGYWNLPDATAAAFGNGWFRTGDLGERSRDGYYTLRGRSSDLIISGGFNIYPREIEEVLLEVPGVAEAAVVGVPDEVRGELPIAYIVGAAEPAEVLDQLRLQLASFKLPRGVVRVDALPRTALGKVQKHLLPPWTGPVT